jgi:2-amino-4-hydroxy-6-hydroxymethyldihydropteridine diphosphokinase
MKGPAVRREAASRSGSGVRAFVALGSNVGERAEHLRAAVERLSSHDAVRVISASRVYESEAHTLPGRPEAPPYLNAVVELRSRLGPRELLGVCLEIEQALGRNRSDAERWAPRTLDIDLLLFGEEQIREQGLSVPHPRMAERRFVLVPLADIAPDLRLPGPSGAAVRELLEASADESLLRPTSIQLTASYGS